MKLPRPRLSVARAIHALALGVLLVMYFGNSDMGGDPVTPRGDGVYRPVLARGDGHLMWLMLRSMVLDGDLDYANDMKMFSPIWPPPTTATGRKGIVHPIGPALVWAAPFVVAHGAAKVANLLGAGIPMHGYTLWHQRIVFTTAPLFALLAVLLGFWLAGRLTGGRWGPLYASMAVLFGTSITVYATFQPWSAHPMDAAATGAFVVLWAGTLGDLRRRRFAALGALLGLCGLIRITGFALAVAPALELAVALARGRGRNLLALAARGALLAVVALVVFTPQLVAWKVVYGEWLTTPMGKGFMRLDHPQLMELLFSSRNGWFATTPLAYAGVLGLLVLLAWRRTRLVAAGLLLVLAVQLWVNASVYDWWGGASYGSRRMVSMTSVLVVGLAAWMALFARLARRLPAAARHGIALAVLGWFVAWNLAAVSRLRAGRPSNARVRPTCCDEQPRLLRAIARPVYDLVGNPFQLPASALFALGHGVSLARWDTTDGAYLFEPGWDEYRNGSYRGHVTVWKLASPAVRPFVLGGFAVSAAGAVTVDEAGELLLPLLHPEAHRFTLMLSAAAPQAVRLFMNGREVARVTAAAAPSEATFDVPAGGLHVGANILRVEGERPGVTAIRVTVAYP